MVQRRPALKAAGAPVCSVCVANYNGRDTLDACIRSILAQDCGFEVEIIVHDDASTDGSADGLQERFPVVELLVSEENVGFCVSNNRMVGIARGQYVLLLNNDAELMPDALRTLHDRAAKQAKPGILGLPQYDASNGALLDRGSLLDPFFNPVPNLDASRREVAMVMGACLWIPRALWQEIGGFPEWFGSIAEDMYLCCCARLRGYTVEVPDASGYRHWVGKSFGGGRVTETGLKTTRKRRALSERNKTFVMLVSSPALIAPLIFPLHFFVLLAEGLVLSILKCQASLWVDIYWNSFVSVWAYRTRLRSERCTLQSARRISVVTFLRGFQRTPYKLKMLFVHGVPRIEP
jgi:GT2 family glycosyltransferase